MRGLRRSINHHIAFTTGANAYLLFLRGRPGMPVRPRSGFSCPSSTRRSGTGSSRRRSSRQCAGPRTDNCPVASAAVRVHLALRVALADLSVRDQGARSPTISVLLCVHLAHLYANVDAWRPFASQNVQICAHLAQLYANVDTLHPFADHKRPYLRTPGQTARKRGRLEAAPRPDTLVPADVCASPSLATP
jgi:hypothetical protein